MTYIRIDKEADKIWDDWYRNLRRDEATKRLDTDFGFKMMMLMAVNEEKTTVDADLMWRVIQLLEYERNVRNWVAPASLCR